jgi:hypothetical protein
MRTAAMHWPYLCDRHLESQGFDAKLPKGDVLVIAGDLCHARCLDPERSIGSIEPKTPRQSSGPASRRT